MWPPFSSIAFVTPVMKYEKRNMTSFLTCSVRSYPHPSITWQGDETPISESTLEEIESSGCFHIYSTVTITGSNSSYECAIENSLLKQTWTGQWTVKGGLCRTFWVHELSEVRGNGDWFIGKGREERENPSVAVRRQTGIPGLIVTGWIPLSNRFYFWTLVPHS